MSILWILYNTYLINHDNYSIVTFDSEFWILILNIAPRLLVWAGYFKSLYSCRFGQPRGIDYELRRTSKFKKKDCRLAKIGQTRLESGLVKAKNRTKNRPIAALQLYDFLVITHFSIPSGEFSRTKLGCAKIYFRPWHA
jgi:hypothetical protein